MTNLAKHGSPKDRGSADKYSGRSFDPHWYPAGTGKGSRIELRDMTVEEIVAYTKGYNEQEDQKDWG